MLAPNVNTVMDDLALAYYSIIKADSLAYASRNTMIGQLSPDLAWLPQIRTQLKLLSAAAGRWQLDKPDMWGPLLSTFTTYSAAFGAYANRTKQLGSDRDRWLPLLTDLRDALNTNANACRAAEEQIAQHIRELNDVESLFKASLDRAWAELSREEQAMIDLAVEVTRLQDQVEQLSSALTAKEIGAGQRYIQSSAVITYGVLIAGTTFTVPYLTIAGLVYTTGKTAYDLIAADDQIRDSLDKIAEKRRQASYEAGAAAMTKGIIQLIYSFDMSLAALKGQMPKFSVMWDQEKTKVEQIIYAIHQGDNPHLFIDLASMPSAAATWAQIGGFITNLGTLAPTPGKPVYLTPGDDPIETTSLEFSRFSR